MTVVTLIHAPHTIRGLPRWRDSLVMPFRSVPLEYSKKKKKKSAFLSPRCIHAKTRKERGEKGRRRINMLITTLLDSLAMTESAFQREVSAEDLASRMNSPHSVVAIDTPTSWRAEEEGDRNISSPSVNFRARPSSPAWSGITCSAQKWRPNRYREEEEEHRNAERIRKNALEVVRKYQSSRYYSCRHLTDDNHKA